MNKLIELLKNPTSQFRSIPFWSWNGVLETKTLGTQIKQMHEAGIGGFFMHARGGLETKYLGEDWMNCVEFCIQITRVPN